jgi:hypothetical protein
MHKVRAMPKNESKLKLEKELTGKDSEPPDLIYFKVHLRTFPHLLHGFSYLEEVCQRVSSSDFATKAAEEVKTSAISQN